QTTLKAQLPITIEMNVRQFGELIIGKIEEIIAEYESREYYRNTIPVPSTQHNRRPGELKKAYRYKTNRPRHQTHSSFSNRKYLKRTYNNRRTECYYAGWEAIKQKRKPKPNNQTQATQVNTLNVRKRQSINHGTQSNKASHNSQTKQCPGQAKSLRSRKHYNKDMKNNEEIEDIRRPKGNPRNTSDYESLDSKEDENYLLKIECEELYSHPTYQETNKINTIKVEPANSQFNKLQKKPNKEILETQCTVWMEKVEQHRSLPSITKLNFADKQEVNSINDKNVNCLSGIDIDRIDVKLNKEISKPASNKGSVNIFDERKQKREKNAQECCK
ncbi:12273_t:CDS:2, partial [Racocetra persica]